MIVCRRPDDMPGGDDLAALVAQHPGAVDGAVMLASGDMHLYGPGCVDKDEHAARGRGTVTHLWRARPLPRQVSLPPADTRVDVRSPVQAGSRTAQALELVRSGQHNPYAAARIVGLDVAAVYRAMRRASRPVCECCGRPMPR